MRPVCSALALTVALAVVGSARPDNEKNDKNDKNEKLTHVQVARLGKAATALVECDVQFGKSHGSAFCIHPSGLFVTNEHVVSGATSVRLVLNPSLKTQKVVKATVVRFDRDNDLALLRAENVKDLPVLKLGDSESAEELMEVVACGFPFGRSLTVQKEDYPAVSINKGTVTALRQKDNALHRIQVDVTLNPGNSGGALLDLKGQVLGVVVSGVRNTAVNFVIPVGLLARFLDVPDVSISLPTVKAVNRHDEFEFTAKTVSVLPVKKGLDLELVLGAGAGKERRFAMKHSEGTYAVKAVPFPAPTKTPVFRVEVKYEDGSVSGTVEDHTFRLGEKKVKLSQLRSLRLGAKAEAKFGNGDLLEGKPADLETMLVKVGKQSLKLDLAAATEISIDTPEVATAISCTIVARRGRQEVARFSAPLYVAGVSRPSLDDLAECKFVKPPRSGSPVSYLRAVSSKGDYIGQGKSYSYDGTAMTVRGHQRGATVTVGGWTLNFGGRDKRSLEVGEYDGAKRFPFSGDAPGLEFYGNGRGCNTLAGKFVVWEFEVKGNEVVRLAIDFIQRGEEKGPPLYGSLRINSSFH